MSRAISRRTVLTGGGAVAVVVLAGGVASVRLRSGRASSADSAAAEYARFLADVRQDYIDGRVVEHSGWVLSQHEADTIAQRAGEHTATRVS